MGISATEQISNKSTLFVYRLLGWCKSAKKSLREAGAKKVSKYVFMYGLYLLIVWVFDYLYMPWLAIKFRYYTFFPLYFSLFFVCLLGLLLYDSFKEDIFFKENIKEWLANKERNKFTQWIKARVNSSPRATFSAIATWWSPLHAYIYFRKEEKNHFWEVMKVFSRGAFYCAFFWGVIVFILSALWDLGKLFIKLYL
jgi:hypothetical protein